jgi:hypothetical protein
LSHLKERKEKNCLNCNAEVQGRFCQVCGQENTEPFETAWHLVTHFFNDITHFDGKFFSTLKYLISRPGFVSREYMIGRRASYLNPVRMYVFTSAIFFLIFFSLNHIDVNRDTLVNGHKLTEITKMDSTTFSAFTKGITGNKPMTRVEFEKYIDTISGAGIRVGTGNYKNKAEYDSLLKHGIVKDNWIQRKLTYKVIELAEKYHNDKRMIGASFLNALVHSFPQMLFISLPLFAFVLKCLYYRRKQYYYASHVIFSIHLYVFVFIFLLILIGFDQLKNYLGWDWIQYLIGAGIIYILFYHYKAMRNFYKQGRGKTILKFLLLCFTMFIFITMLFGVFSLFSLFKI